MKDNGCSNARLTMVCQSFAGKQHYFRTLGKLGVCALLANSALAADPPQNVTSKLYSSTAGEIFWDRVSGPIIGYELTRNGVNLGVVDATSFFDDTLQADTRYTYTVASVEPDETRSSAVYTVFGPFESATDILSEFRVEVYSSSSAELFWNRPQTTGLQYEVTFNGNQVFNTDGISLYLDSLDSQTPYEVSIRATNLATGVDSPVRQLQFTTSGGSVPGLSSPINADNAINVLSLALPPMSRNGHNEVRDNLSKIRFIDAENQVAGFTLVQTESFENAGTRFFRDTYECGDGGSLMLESPRNAFGDAVLLFEDCAASDTIRNGSVDYTFTGTTLLTDYQAYSELQLAPVSRENVTIKINGQAIDGGDRIGSSTIEAVSGLDYFRNTRAGEQQITGMQQTISASAEDLPRNSLDTSFDIEAFWTQNRTLKVETLTTFQNIDTESGRYTVGLLRITDPSAPGNYIEFDIATGQSDTFQLTVFADDVMTSELRDWDELSPIELPCVLVGNPVNGPEICR